MDVLLTKKANELARELAGQATTIEDLNGAIRSLMKTAIETMLHSEMSVHRVRVALRYTTDKDGKAVARDLRQIDTSATVL